MRRTHKHWLSMLVLVGIGILATAPPANADFRLRIDDLTTGTGTVITGTVNPVTGMGVITTGQISVGGFTVVITTGITQHKGPFNFAELDLNSIQVTGGAGHIRLALEDTGYTRTTGSGLLQLLATTGGTLTGGAGSGITLQSWANGGNAVPTYGADQAVGAIGANPLTPPAGSTAAWTPPGFTSGPGAFSSTATAGFGPSSLYSLFSQVDIVFGAGGGSASFDEDQQVVPVPGGLALAISAVPCLGFGYWLRRKKLQLA